MERQTKLPVRLWLLILCVVMWSGHGEMLRKLMDLRDATQLCPYTDFCTSSARSVLYQNLIPCCKSCFCSEFCWARGDCCTDVQTTRPENIRELEGTLECVSESHQFLDGLAVPLHDNDTRHIWMISKCVGNTDIISKKCHVTSDSSVLDLIPVWSPSTRNVYRNLHCALCYAVTDFEFLSVAIGYLTGYLNASEDSDWETIDYLIRHPVTYPYTLTVYETVPHEFAYCNLTQVDGCPYKNDSDIGEYDGIIRDRCDTFSHPFEDFDNNMLFKNIHCYLCNIEYQMYNTTHGYVPIAEIAGFRSPPPLMELISATTRKTHVRRECEESQILDPFMNKCRPLLCPELSQPYNGDCYYTQGWHDSPRTASFVVTIDSSIYIPATAEQTSTMILTRLLSWGDKDMIDFVFCSMQVGITEHDSSAVDYYVSMGFGHFFDYKQVRSMHQFMSSDLLMYGLNVRLLKDVDARQFSYIWEWNWTGEVCNGNFELIKMWCPTLELSEDDFRYIVRHNILPPDYQFNNPSTLAVNQSAVRQICVQDYLHDGLPRSRASKLDSCPQRLFCLLLFLQNSLVLHLLFSL